MTMAAKSARLGVGKNKLKRGARGQSVVEFALLLPVLVGLFYILIQANSAITTAIVHQKYVRMRLHFMALNHRYYPQLDTLSGRASDNVFQRWWIGIGDPVTYGLIDPPTRAPEISIGRVSVAEDQMPKEEYPSIQRRQKVRVRVAAFTCLAPTAAKFGQNYSEGYLGEETFAGGNYRYCQR